MLLNKTLSVWFQEEEESEKYYAHFTYIYWTVSMTLRRQLMLNKTVQDNTKA